MKQFEDLYSTTYEESRVKFLHQIKEMERYWDHAKHIKYQVGEPEDDLTIDVLCAEALENKKNLLLITTGEHGVEGYIGSAILQLFMNEFMQALNPKNTGLVLVHAINPWGMKHYRRTNENNVDLNRNFIWEWDKLNRSLNKGYREGKDFFLSSERIKSKLAFNIRYGIKLLKVFIKLGAKGLSDALLYGQYEFPKGTYYGGDGYEANTKHMIALYKTYYSSYDRIVMIDIHTGYGPSDQMCITNSSLERFSSEELSRQFAYPLVQKTDAKEFYSINGDMIDFVYLLHQNEFKQKDFYATVFEFGTFGDSMAANLKSLKAIISENQAFWHGSDNKLFTEQIKRNFLELFYPSDLTWRKKAVDDAKLAFKGILKAKHFI